MPAKHTAVFKVRHYECDAYGHLNNANYVRYMEEAAFEASASVGYSKERYESMGFLWLARETEIEYLLPVMYGDTLHLTTFVGDFRRVRSRRFYEFRRDDELVARASTDWVYIDSTTGGPTAVPEDMIKAFVPEGLSEPAAPRGKFPAPPAPPVDVFTLRRRVEWRDIDTAQHVNNAAYINYIEDAGMQVSTHFGWPLTRSVAAGFGVVARKHHIEYRGQARLDDELTVATWVSSNGRATADRYYTVKRGDELLVQAQTQWVWVDLATRKPIRIPAQFLADFEPNMVASANPPDC